MRDGEIRPSQRRRKAPDDDDDRASHIEWVERQAIDSIKARYATAEIIAKEAQTTLTVLLAGVGGTAAYASKMFEPGPAEPLTIAAAAVCGYLAALSAILVLACMRFESYPAQFQEPKNLLIDDAKSLDIRESELHNLDARIKEVTAINVRKSDNLNTIRLLAVFSIVVFVAVGALAPRRTSPPAPALTIQCSPAPSASAPSSLTCSVTS